MLYTFRKHTLFEVLRQIIIDNQLPFDNPLRPSVGACKIVSSFRRYIFRRLPTSIAMTMIVVLGLLHGVNHVGYRLYVFLLVRWYFFHALILPMDVLPLAHRPLVFSLI